MADDQCGSADEQLRDGLGVVLLDVDDGECDAVGLEEGRGEWDFADEDVE